MTTTECAVKVAEADALCCERRKLLYQHWESPEGKFCKANPCDACRGLYEALARAMDVLKFARSAYQATKRSGERG